MRIGLKELLYLCYLDFILSLMTFQCIARLTEDQSPTRAAKIKASDLCFCLQGIQHLVGETGPASVIQGLDACECSGIVKEGEKIQLGEEFRT